MAGFYDNRILPDEVSPPPGDQSPSQFQSLSGATSTSVLDSQMPTATSFDDALPNESQGMRRQLQQRRSSYTAPYDSSADVYSHNAGRRLSMMEFGTSDDALRSFQFSQNMMSDFGGADAVGGFHSGNMGGVPGFPLEMMSNMMPASFANMSVNPLAAGDPGMSLGGAPLGNNLGVHDSPVSLDIAEQGGHFLPGNSVMGTAAEEQQHLTSQGNLGATTGQHTFGSNDGRSLPIEADTPMQPKETPTHPPHPYPSREGHVPSNPLQTGPERPPETNKKSVYSKSGFDMLRALWYVATRKNPEIHIGAVDLSCAFVVCDVTMNDCPIIYVSDNFQNLTGYSRHEIMGKNCRFLQSPDGKVEAGVKREFVDDAAVYKLKAKIEARREVQQSLINYRKGGKPFLNLLTMVPIPWDTEEIRYFVGFQIDLVETPEAISSTQGAGGLEVDYKYSDIGQYIWEPPNQNQCERETGQTLGTEDVSTLLQQFITKGAIASEWHRQSWHKMLLENTDDVVHVLSLKGVFQYLSPTCKRLLEYDPSELVGSSLSSICHPSDIVPVIRELKDATVDTPVNVVFRIRRKLSGYMWFESYGSLFSEQGKGRKCIILLGRKRPVFSLGRRSVEARGGINDSELWAKMSTSGMFLFVSSNSQLLLDLQPEAMVGSSIHDLMRKESRPEFGRAIEKARRGKIVDCKHEVHNRRGQVLQAHTFLYPGDGNETKPSFLLAQIKLIKASSRSPGAGAGGPSQKGAKLGRPDAAWPAGRPGTASPEDQQALSVGPDDVMFSELGTTKCSSWQFELRQMEKVNRILAEELSMLLTSKKKRKRRKGSGSIIRDCANCHTRNTPEWRRGPSGQRDLCNSCGLRWAKQMGRVSPRNSSRAGSGGNGDSQNRLSNSSVNSSPPTQDPPGESAGEADRPSEGCAGRASNAGGSEGSGNPASGNCASQQAISMPPPSQPLLEGGSGVEMTSIREE